MMHIDLLHLSELSNVMFTGQIPPPLHKGSYSAKMASSYIALEVCLSASTLLTVCNGHNISDAASYIPMYLFGA